MYEIIRVGIPIRNCDITESFISIIEEIKTSNECIALTTVDYVGNLDNNPEIISSPAGHKLILKNLEFVKYNNELKFNVINTIGFIWDIKKDGQTPRDGTTVVNYLLSFLDNNCPDLKKIYIFTTGSPHYYDMFTFFIKKIRPVSIIDTFSAIVLSLNAMREMTGIPVIDRNYIPDFIENKNNNIIEGSINLFGGISNNYKPDIKMPLIQHFFINMKQHLSPDDRFFYCSIDETGVNLKSMSFYDALNNIEYFSKPETILTYGVYKNDNSRTIS